MNKIILDVGFANLVAELGSNIDFPEITVNLEDKKDGFVIQDIALLRPIENSKDRAVECLVWGDEYTEDYTHKLKIKMYEER